MRYIFFITLSIVGFLFTYVAFLLGVVLYLVRYTGYELLLVAVCIDSFFGLGDLPYLYTASVGTLLVIASMIKPFLRTPHTE